MVWQMKVDLLNGEYCMRNDTLSWRFWYDIWRLISKWRKGYDKWHPELTISKRYDFWRLTCFMHCAQCLQIIGNVSFGKLLPKFIFKEKKIRTNKIDWLDFGHFWRRKGSIDTLFEIFIFCPKNQFWFPEKIVDFFWGEKLVKYCGMGLFSCWQLWFHEKNCQKNFGWKTR